MKQLHFAYQDEQHNDRTYTITANADWLDTYVHNGFANGYFTVDDHGNVRFVPAHKVQGLLATDIPAPVEPEPVTEPTPATRRGRPKAKSGSDHKTAGTNRFAGGVSLVGEHGPELVMLPRGK